MKDDTLIGSIGFCLVFVVIGFGFLVAIHFEIRKIAETIEDIFNVLKDK